MRYKLSCAETLSGTFTSFLVNLAIVVKLACHLSTLLGFHITVLLRKKPADFIPVFLVVMDNP